MMLNYGILQGKTFREVAEIITLAGNPIGKVRDGEGGREIRVSIVGRAVIYIRVSREKQTDGASLEVQLEACRRYCEAHGLGIIAEL
jgi:hypothetical protein